ncbi:hypothetical protein HK098_001670 [Nowakowskiella sp. JEL0407]|nr:hypothetical protein HK098_001670 [Nowakowskiella sp. JEL0407]
MVIKSSCKALLAIIQHPLSATTPTLQYIEPNINNVLDSPSSTSEEKLAILELVWLFCDSESYLSSNFLVKSGFISRINKLGHDKDRLVKRRALDVIILYYSKAENPFDLIFNGNPPSEDQIFDGLLLQIIPQDGNLHSTFVGLSIIGQLLFNRNYRHIQTQFSKFLGAIYAVCIAEEWDEDVISKNGRKIIVTVKQLVTEKKNGRKKILVELVNLIRSLGHNTSGFEIYQILFSITNDSEYAREQKLIDTVLECLQILLRCMIPSEFDQMRLLNLLIDCLAAIPRSSTVKELLGISSIIIKNMFMEISDVEVKKFVLAINKIATIQDWEIRCRLTEFFAQLHEQEADAYCRFLKSFTNSMRMIEVLLKFTKEDNYLVRRSVVKTFAKIIPWSLIEVKDFKEVLNVLLKLARIDPESCVRSECVDVFLKILENKNILDDLLSVSEFGDCMSSVMEDHDCEVRANGVRFLEVIYDKGFEYFLKFNGDKHLFGLCSDNSRIVRAECFRFVKSILNTRSHQSFQSMASVEKRMKTESDSFERFHLVVGGLDLQKLEISTIPESLYSEALEIEFYDPENSEANVQMTCYDC